MMDEARLLGIDHGAKRIGVAISDPLGMIARPLTVIRASTGKDGLNQLAALLQENEVGKVVVGLPTDAEGHIGQQASIVVEWAQLLAGTISIPVIMWDEFLSTQQAKGYTRRRTRSAKRRRRELDAVAAAVILQSYLEARRGEDEPGRPIQTFISPA